MEMTDGVPSVVTGTADACICEHLVEVLVVTDGTVTTVGEDEGTSLAAETAVCARIGRIFQLVDFTETFVFWPSF
jgi:hypothetical protein